MTVMMHAQVIAVGCDLPPVYDNFCVLHAFSGSSRSLSLQVHVSRTTPVRVYLNRVFVARSVVIRTITRR